MNDFVFPSFKVEFQGLRVACPGVDGVTAGVNYYTKTPLMFHSIFVIIICRSMPVPCKRPT